MSEAQTKLISHKSHSGSKRSFSKAYKNSLFNLSSSNFGLPKSRNLTLVDSIIALNDSVTILRVRKSKSCHPYGTNYKKLDSTDYYNSTDTVVKDNILHGQNTVSSIKQSWNGKYSFWYANPVGEIVFIGFKEED